MYHWFGRILSRSWPAWLAAWALLWAGSWMAAPRWRDVARDGEFQFLPRDAHSRRGEDLLHRAFPTGRAESSAVILLTREDDPHGLNDADRRFVIDALRPGLEQIAHEHDDSQTAREPSTSRNKNIIRRIRAFDDKEAGALLISDDRHAMVVIVELTTNFMVRRNIPVLHKIDDLIARLQREHAVPAGLRIGRTGSAELGRDQLEEESDSARTIQSWTVWLVVILLLIFYRAPVTALVPLLTLYVAVGVAIRLLLLLGRAGYVELFRGLDVYVTVVAYAAGVDYNLFLISRYREELNAEPHVGTALAEAVGRIGGALTASAATVICGIGTLMFAGFGKFREAGFGIAFSLFVMLCATMTLTPALLRLFGRWTFWPWPVGARQREKHEARPAWVRTLVTSWSPFQALWRRVGHALEKRPGTIWLLTVLVLSPAAGYAVLNYDNLNYGLLQGLPKDAPSVLGTKALTRHYPAGDAGPLTLVLRNDRVDFAKEAGVDVIRELDDRLRQHRHDLRIADVRSVAHPLGMTPAASAAMPGGGPLTVALAGPLVIGRAIDHYVSDTKALDHHVTYLSLVLEIDPYTRRSIRDLDILEAAIRRELPATLQRGTELYLTGATPSFRDLKAVADRDRIRINLLVTASVLVILIVLLRRLVIPIYLILSVLFGYLVTLGVTFAIFRFLDGPSFPGLDWTVPIFLFTLLIAVGEDYNIILVARIDEEQNRHGPVRGVTEALMKTGGIISGCGFIMAGTFSSLAFGGSLPQMYQLGCALTFGVLLDTFIVRPVLVPAYIIWANRGGSRRLGARTAETRDAVAQPR